MFIQRFLLFLGEPVYTFAVVLVGLLGFSGIGSWVVGRLDANNRSSLIWIIPSILAVLLLDAILSPWIFNSALGLPLAWRIIVVVMLAPLGIFLGMPFPTGLRIVADEVPAFIAWAWGVNGFLYRCWLHRGLDLRNGVWIYSGARDEWRMLSCGTLSDDDDACCELDPENETVGHGGGLRLG